MINCEISEAAKEQLPTLLDWLRGAWIDASVNPDIRREKSDHVRVLLDSEMERATYRDIIVGFRAGPPSLVPANDGLPLRIEFGFEDMAFGHALISEAIRGGNSPAVGEPASAKQMEFASRVAKSDANVLIMGQTGVGKEGMAQFVHNQSERAEKPFVAVNCAALPETMVEAILFGHKKGAFTGATGASEGLFRAADGGTLFLDEITELPLMLQAKLLRALQEGEILPVGETTPVNVDVRIVAAANRDFEDEVASGRFREDLYWRLNVMPIDIPALAERRQDIRAIAAAMLLSMQAKSGRFCWPTEEALKALSAHAWPGNARELHNVLQRATILSDETVIEAADLGLAATPVSRTPRADPVEPGRASKLMRGQDLHSLSREVQHEAIVDALEKTDGNRRETAKILGISERTLRYRLADMREIAA